jgi:hypothetical protein
MRLNGDEPSEFRVSRHGRNHKHEMALSPRRFEMSAMGHEQTSRHVCVMSVIPLKADMCSVKIDVRFVPIADVACLLNLLEVTWLPASVESEARHAALSFMFLIVVLG